MPLAWFASSAMPAPGIDMRPGGERSYAGLADAGVSAALAFVIVIIRAGYGWHTVKSSL